MRKTILICYVLTSLAAICIASAAELRVGIIGCDTSHAIAFTETWNNAQSKGHIVGFKVVAAFRGGSADIQQSVKLQEEIVPKLKEKYGVTFYDSIENLCKNVDAVCLESLDGRPKLEQIKPVLKAGKPVFVDKPFGVSLKDAKEIFRLANEARVPIFTSSSLRFGKNTQAVSEGAIGVVTNASTFGPCETDPHHPEMYWYGVHGIEALFTVMGTGCESVRRGTNAQGKIEVVGKWRGGRVGVFAEDKDFRGSASGVKGELAVGKWDGYVPLVEAISKFFRTGIAPVRPEETLEIYAFMDASEESRIKDGAVISLQSGYIALPR
jgi:hypothetical protein